MERGRGDDGKDQQQQRGKGKMSENHTPNTQPHYNCPRCNSKNTKFCYYNNYSINQPRYFCKSCRRYWTQGGSQRNVPVGGGTRRGRRDKMTPLVNGEGLSRPMPSGLLGFSKPLQMPTNLSGMLGFLSKSYGIGKLPGNPPMKDASPGIMPPMNSHYSCGGGFISSLDGMQNLNLTPPPPQGFNRPLRIGEHQMSNQSMRPQQTHVPNNSQDMNNRGKEPMYPSDQSFFQATRPMGPWNYQGFSNDPMAASSSNIWSTSDHDNAAATSNGSVPDAVLDPNEWPDDLPDFDPPEF